VDVGAVAPAGTVVAEEKLGLGSLRAGGLRFTIPRDLPIGKYKVEVKADDQPWSALEFNVVAPPKPTPLEKPADLLPLAVGTKWEYSLVHESGPGVKVTLPGTTRGEDGKLRGPVSYTVAGEDEHGTRVELRRGDLLVLEEWWRLDKTGLALTRQRAGKDEFEADPPLPTIRLPLKAPSSWEYKPKDKSFQRKYRMWGPLPVTGPEGRAPGYVILSSQPTPSGMVTIERHFAPGIGVVREVQITAGFGQMLTRLEWTVVPKK
jgi:hypothetical protein